MQRMKGRRMRLLAAGLSVLSAALFLLLFETGENPVEAAGLNVMVDGRDTGSTAGRDGEIAASYREYLERFESIATMEDIYGQGYDIVEKHVFDVPMVTVYPESVLGQLSEEDGGEPQVARPADPLRVSGKDALSRQLVPTVRFFSAIDRTTRRAAVFLADRDGAIIYKCNRLECNYTVLGEVEQPITDIISVAFMDLNGDKLMDIILIAGCVNDTGNYAGKTYKVGEVLFQAQESDPEAGSLSFYRDWRVNDKINRFDMNKSAKCIISFVRDSLSTEFLYTATTEQELLSHNFKVIKEQSYWHTYEKLGRLKVLPGIFSMADYDIFMIFLVNEQGDIVWSFQPMGDYDNLYSLRGISAKDMDGDGMKDLLVAARYSREGENGELIVESAFSVYYQMTGGFVEDTDFVKDYRYDSKETVEGLIKKIRAYWGWQDEGRTDK